MTRAVSSSTAVICPIKRRLEASSVNSHVGGVAGPDRWRRRSSPSITRKTATESLGAVARATTAAARFACTSSDRALNAARTSPVEKVYTGA
jgi:hypothetical protein